MNRPKSRNANGLFKDPDNIHLKTVFWNSDGLTNVKFTEFKAFITNHNVDLYGIAEAGAATDNIQFFQIPGYQTYFLKRERQVASGIVVAAKSSLVVDFKIRKAMESRDKLETVELAVWKNGLHRKIFFLYNPPNNIPDLNWLETLWDNKCIILGDMNAHSPRWGYKTTNRSGKIWEDFIDSNAALLVENELREPTFLAYSGLRSHPDLVIAHSSLASKLTHTLAAGHGGFGHKMLLVKISTTTDRCFEENRKPRWNISKGDWAKYTRLTEKEVTGNLVTKNVDQSLKSLQEVIRKCTLQCVPRGQVKRYRSFWNQDLQRMKKERDRVLAEVEADGNERNRCKLKEKNAILKRNILEAKRATYRGFLEKLDFRKEGTKAHRFVSNLNGEKQALNNPLFVPGKMLTSGKQIAKYFCSHYSKVSNFTPKKENGRLQVQSLVSCLSEEDDSLFNEIFNIDELDAALRDTPKRKCAGPDEILPESLIYLGPEARKVILNFLNLVWLSHYPAEWRKAEIIPILKKGKTADKPEHFRPVSLTSVFSKVFERLVLKRLKNYLELNKHISCSQAGFQRNRGTIEQVAQLSQDIKDGFHRKQSTLAVLVDFKTAFDRVWRKKLLQKLSILGVRGNLFAAVSSFLCQRFIRVRHNSSTSSFRQTRQGLPQGSVLSPCLFNVMINDVLQVIDSTPGVKALLYADDLVIWATSSNINALNITLNGVLIKLKKWADSNEMLINTSKTECQLFTMSTKPPVISLKYDGQVLSKSDSATYLGVVLDNKLNWSKHIHKLCEQGEKRTNLLRRLTGTKWGAQQDIISLTYKTYVRPVIEYGAEVIITASDNSLSKLDLVQNKALRVITGGPRSTPITAMELQADLEPLGMRRDMAALRLHERLKRSVDQYWIHHIPSKPRLKTQGTFISKIGELLEKHDMEALSARQGWPSLRELAPNYLARRNLDLTSPVQKGITPDYELRAIFLETVAIRYPSSTWLHVYTDGSAKSATRDAGAGVFCNEFQMSEPVGKISSNFEGEIWAIQMALNKLTEREDQNIVLLVDSKSAIIAVTSNEPTDLIPVLRCRQLVSEILYRSNLIFQWCPSHCGITGNDHADALAKKGSQLTQPQRPLSFSTAKNVIKGKLKDFRTDYFKRVGEGRTWEALVDNPIPRHLPRKEGVACFRMQTGHDFLAKHLHRIGVLPSATCPLCNRAEMTALHLETCPSLGDLTFNSDETLWSKRSKLYWAARSRMADLPNVGVG